MNIPNDFSDFKRNAVSRTYSTINKDIELNKEKKDILDNNYIIEDNINENYPFILNSYYNYPMYLDQDYEYSLSSTNENKIFDSLNIPFPFDNIEDNEILFKKEKIFEITKIKKNTKIGRIKKNSGLIGKHNKLSQDNIIRKIKGRFHEKVRLYINEEYKIYCLKNESDVIINNWLKKIDPKYSRKIKKQDNLKWFKSKLYEVFSENVSSKYSSHSPDSNKQKIKKLISSTEANNVKNILNTTIEELFNKYIANENIKGFKTLKDDLLDLEKQMKETGQDNIKEYLNKYEYVAKNMKKIFKKKSARKIKNVWMLGKILISIIFG